MRFELDFGSLWAGLLGPKRVPKSIKFTSLTKDASKKLQEGPKRPQESPKRPQEGPKRDLKRHQERPLDAQREPQQAPKVK